MAPAHEVRSMAQPCHCAGADTSYCSIQSPSTRDAHVQGQASSPRRREKPPLRGSPRAEAQDHETTFCEVYASTRIALQGFPRPSKYVYLCLRPRRHHTDTLTFGALAQCDMTGAQTTQASVRPPCERGRGGELSLNDDTDRRPRGQGGKSSESPCVPGTEGDAKSFKGSVRGRQEAIHALDGWTHSTTCGSE